MTHQVSVEIFGVTYVIKSKADPQYTKKLAMFLDNKMKEVSEKTKVISTTKIAVLASLNIADELFRLKKNGHDKSADDVEEVEEKVSKLLDLIDDSKLIQ